MFIPSLLVSALTLLTPRAEAAEFHQCVYNAYGTGYVANVKWYGSSAVKVDAYGETHFGKVSVEKTIAVGERSCVTTKSAPATAVVSAVGGEYAKPALQIGSGVAVGVGGILVCVGTVGVGCPVAAVAIAGVVEGGIAFIPEPPAGAFWAGAPGNLELHGTVWDPTGTIVREFNTGKPAGESCSSNSDCSNDACARPHADGASLQCCASGRTTNYGGYDYCAQMSAGTVCWSDAMCASGNCSGNLGGMQRGECD